MTADTFCSFLLWVRVLFLHADDLSLSLSIPCELDESLVHGVDGVVAAHLGVGTRANILSPLTNDDVARAHHLAAELLDPETLARRVAAILRRASSLLGGESDALQAMTAFWEEPYSGTYPTQHASITHSEKMQ